MPEHTQHNAAPTRAQGDAPFAAFRRRIAGIPIGWLILFLAFANLMLAVPQLDLAVAGLFYTPGVGFTAHGQPWERLLYHSVDVLMVVGNLALVGVWLFNRRRGRRLLGLTGRRLALLLCLLALLPGLLVNQVFKEHWGRARPVQVTQFGGDRPFTPAFVYTGGSGGAFSSGHVAAAAYVIAVAHLLSGARPVWVLPAAVYTALVALARMAAGGHFLSDAVTSVFLVLFGYLALRRLMLGTAQHAGSKRAD
ncbi:phosphatase PAP2 family protein [uncultured Thiohalocapsa sp.]|uniref:phosphatase PAP2 family protein n=1 Tax=uncultured Thiohalocapsa sp. TaxID=768990 RepID=UPI0025EA5621|nr:phosphatase PAP2 family protein [uncultured Thiohalocapsa sp.]